MSLSDVFPPPKKYGRSVALVSPLDWGLGHATRCIPLIRQLQKQGYRVVAAGNGASLNLLKSELKDIICENYPGRAIRYSKHLPLLMKLLLQLPKFMRNSIYEKRAARKLCVKYQAELILSDNRYGFRHPGVESVFMTHQISPHLPRFWSWMRFFVRRFHIRVISRFDRCLIPDFAGEKNLSGALSHGFRLPDNFQYIGPLSRFHTDRNCPPSEKDRVTAIVSGPEPQRSIFEKILRKQASNLNKKILIAGGRPVLQERLSGEGYLLVNHLDTEELQKEICRSDYVVCRAGYSTVMDTYALKKKALCIPTPGQTEQIYLAKYLSDNEIVASVSLKSFDWQREDKRMQIFDPNFQF